MSDTFWHKIKARYQRLETMPPKIAMQRSIYWGVMTIASLLILFASYYIQHIPAEIESRALGALNQAPWLQPHLFVDGRNLALRGNIESVTDLEDQVVRLQQLPGVRTVRNEIEQEIKPSAVFQLSHSNGRVDLGGKLSGEDLDQVIRSVRNAFPAAGIRDRIQIDDRVGRPLWMGKLEQTLTILKPLESLGLYGWRDALLVDGVAESATLAKRIEYSLPVSMRSGVELNYQVRTRPAENAASLFLISGWNGTALRARVESEQAGQTLLKGLALLADPGVEDSISTNVIVDPDRQQVFSAEDIATLMPALARVHDVRLDSSAEKLILWGRVDSSQLLGDIVSQIKNTGLDEIVDNRLVIDSAARQPEISLFRDSDRLIISGRLPNQRSRVELLEAMGEKLGIQNIEDFINIEPNIAFSPWLDHWSMLLPVMPPSAFGLTVSGNGVMVTGPVSSDAEKNDVLRALNAMFPDMQSEDWLTVGTQ